MSTDAIAAEASGAPPGRGLLSTPRGTRGRISWLLLFRTVIITVLLVTTVGLRVGSGQPLLGPASVVLYSVCAASYVSILIGALWLRSGIDRGILTLAYLQLLGDSAVAMVLVIATGGHESAFVFLFSLAILNAAAVLDRQAAVVLAVVSSVLYLIIVSLELSISSPPLGLPATSLVAVSPSVVANVLAFFLVAILSGSLTEQLRRASVGLDMATARLREVGATHEAVLASLPSGVLTVDDELRVSFLNDSACQILATSQEAATGAPLSRFLPNVPDDARELDRFELQVDVGGTARIIGGSIAPLSRGEIPGRVVVFQDLTELRRLQSALARADRLQIVGRFAAGLAHEIRNPLAAMLGCLQLLRHEDGTLDPDAGRMIDITHREAQRLSKLVTDFLIYARPAPPELASTSLGDVVRDAIETVRDADVAAQRTPLTIDVTMPEPVTADVDPGQVRQILLNLLMNAASAARGELGPPPSPRESRVLVTLARRGPLAVVTVDDSGPGIQPEDRARVFLPFFTRRPSGTGLGLATSHQLALGLDGELDVEESPLGGARFVLSVPVHRAAGARDG